MVHVNENETDSPDYGDRAAFFEPTVSDRNVGIKIRNLTKVCLRMRLSASYLRHTYLFIYLVT